MPQTTEFKLGVDGVAAFEFSDGTTKTVDLANVSGGGGGSTNLTLTQTATDVTVVSDTGTDATIPTATSSNAGVMSAAQVTALAGKQSAIPSGTSKLLAAPATNGADPVQITLGTNLSLSGTTLNATGSGGSTTIVNDLTTGGTSSALSAEMGKLLQATKAAVVNASPVVATGVTSLTRTAVTTAGAEAPTGYYNRPLISDHSVTVDTTGAAAGDALMVLNSSGSSITLTASGTVVNIPAGKTGEVAYNGTSWIDPTQSGGSGYTDAQALAASVLSGTLGTDTTKAPTHSAVTNAISAISGSNIGVIAPSAFSVIPVSSSVSTGTAVGATITIPANTLGARGAITIKWEMLKSGTTDAVAYALRVGPIGGTALAATEIQLVGPTAANPSVAFTQRLRATGTTMRALKHGLPYDSYWTTSANTINVPVDQAAGFVIYIICPTGTTDTVSVQGAHAEYVKVA